MEEDNKTGHTSRNIKKGHEYKETKTAMFWR